MAGLDARKELALLVNSHYPIIYLETWEEGRATEILAQVAQDLLVPFYVWTLTAGLARAGGAPIYNTGEPIQVLAELNGMEADGLFLLKDFHKHLDDLVIVRKLRDLTQQFRRARRSIIISAPVVNIPIELEKDVARFALGFPDDAELTQLVQTSVHELEETYRIRNQLPCEQMPEVVRSLSGLTREEARRVLAQSVLESGRFDQATVSSIRAAKGKLIKAQGVLEFLNWESGLDAIGGVERLKDWLAKRRDALTPEAARYGVEPPRGILVMGVQGCGKSLCAKAVAREWNMQLLKFDCGSLFDKFVGESEKNLRKSLRVAEAVAPAVLWIDEIEKMFPRSSLTTEADGGVSMRIFGSFLTWLQEKKAPVFVVATSNDIACLPAELLRKGRFDEIFFVDLPRAEERQGIFGIHLACRKQAVAKFDLATLAAATEGFSGAEIEQVVKSALYSAFSVKTDLSTDLILKEVEATHPLSQTMRERVNELREWARGRTVPAN
ncbi:MAG: AAA family ATPase [Acidobacteriia bacterium]|nr:AAA family ATPase [Terriglobia bacterium]